MLILSSNFVTIALILSIFSILVACNETLMSDILLPGPMEELHSLDPRRQELLEARFTGAVSGNTGGSTGSTSGGAKVTAAQEN